MFDINFTEPTPPPELTSAQLFAVTASNKAQQYISDEDTFVSDFYNGMWANHDTNPQEVVDRFVAMGPGCKQALTALAIKIGALIQIFSLFPGTEKIIARLQGMVAKPGWKIIDNGDGTMTATPPT